MKEERLGGRGEWQRRRGRASRSEEEDVAEEIEAAPAIDLSRVVDAVERHLWTPWKRSPRAAGAGMWEMERNDAAA